MHPNAEMDAKKAKDKGGHTNPDERKKRKDARAKLDTIDVLHQIPDDERTCPSCGEACLPIGGGEVSYELEWVPGRFVYKRHVVEKGRCPCKQHYASAPTPERVVPGGLYGPGFIAKLIVDRCGDATPLYRVERELERLGAPVARSTLGDLVHAGADALKPLYDLVLTLVKTDQHVQADETSMRVQGLDKRGFVWTFLSPTHVAYVFADNRRNDTPEALLANTRGTLTVAAFASYNSVTTLDGRIRQGCWSHVRRGFFEVDPNAPDVRAVLDMILELFAVERKAKNTGVMGTSAHLKLRRTRSVEVLGKILKWMRDTRPKYEPSSMMGRAISYMVNQWSALTSFIDDADVPIHNNASEAALRIIALIRKNSMFFGSVEAGRRYAVLHTLLACCDIAKINPLSYFADVLLRVRSTPADGMRELLPDRWKPLSVADGDDADSAGNTDSAPTT